MNRVLIYSALLLAGMAASQTVMLDSVQPWLQVLTMSCLSYIMVEVGLEFSASAGKPRQYALDFGVASAAAVVPWLLCAAYFMGVAGAPARDAGLVGLFAAATSAGVLFTMLAAAGLSRTWVFQKARVLAIFDDLVTVFLMVPLQILFNGFQWNLGLSAVLNISLLFAGFRWLNRVFWPVHKPWLLLYGCLIAGVSRLLETFLHIHLGVLLPAFVLGCLLHHQGTLKEGDDPHSRLDQGLKALFMFLVGCSLPPVVLGTTGLGVIAFHVLALTVLSNLGKCVPALFYRNEAGLRERLALSVAMFPRGEVGAGVLLVALSYGVTGLPVVLGSLSLALNLLLTSVFIRVVTKLTAEARNEKRETK
jgi:Kef-type K+ transport system membrane component KefB